LKGGITPNGVRRPLY